MKKVKNMTKKRILAMTLSLLLILCLSGCGRKEASLGTESTVITETSDAAAETTENCLQRVLSVQQKFAGFAETQLRLLL